MFNDDVIKEFINECFIKDIIFGGNSICNNFYDEDSVNNHETLPNNNSSDACISNDVNDVESAISHDEIMIHPNSNSNGIIDAILLLMKRAKLMTLAKSPFSTTL